MSEKKHLHIKDLKVGTWVNLGTYDPELGDSTLPGKVVKMDGKNVHFIICSPFRFFGRPGTIASRAYADIRQKQAGIYAISSKERDQIIVRERVRTEREIAELQSYMKHLNP